jgi:hypothetical protein
MSISPRLKAFLGPFAILGVLTAAESAMGAPAQRMRDLQDGFARCFQAPQGASGSRINFYFSLLGTGQVSGRLRTVVYASGANRDERTRVRDEAIRAFNGCLPLSLSPDMKRTIPGKVYLLQFAIGSREHEDTVVTLKPYGSTTFPELSFPTHRRYF